MSVMTTDTVVADHDLATPPASGTQTPVHKPSRHDVQRPMTLPSRLLGQTVDETSHQDLVSERCKKLTAILVRYKDSISYSIIFVIGLPIYLVTGVGLPVQLGVNVLAYFVAFSLPQKQKKYIHPVLGCSALSIIGIWLLALLYSGIHGIPAQEALKVGLKEYSKGKKYLVLFDDANQSSGWQAKIPGAGDIFSSLLDIGIVGLGLPMFKYRQELKRHVRNAPPYNSNFLFYKEAINRSLILNNGYLVSVNLYTRDSFLNYLTIRLSRSLSRHWHLTRKIFSVRCSKLDISARYTCDSQLTW